jgi:hypothetical protein
VFDFGLSQWQRRRRLRLSVHRASFKGSTEPYYFLNCSNLSADRDIVVTHVWFATKPQVSALPAERPLPKRLKPEETWETWVAAESLGSLLPKVAYRCGRARLSNGSVVKSIENKGVPEEGFVPRGQSSGS